MAAHPGVRRSIGIPSPPSATRPLHRCHSPASARAVARATAGTGRAPGYRCGTAPSMVGVRRRAASRRASSARSGIARCSSSMSSSCPLLVSVVTTTLDTAAPTPPFLRRHAQRLSAVRGEFAAVGTNGRCLPPRSSSRHAHLPAQHEHAEWRSATIPTEKGFKMVSIGSNRTPVSSKASRQLAS